MVLNEEVSVWDTDKFNPPIQIGGGGDRAGLMAFSPDGEMVIKTDQQSGMIRLLDTSPKGEVWSVQPPGLQSNPYDPYYFGVGWSPDGSMIVFHLDGEMFVLDAETGAEVYRQAAAPGESFRGDILWLGDSRTLVVANGIIGAGIRFIEVGH